MVANVLRLLALFITSQVACGFTASAQPVATGHLPVVAVDKSGTIHLVYGQDSTIYYISSLKNTSSLSKPNEVAVLPNLVAHAKRGPQLAVTDQYVVITAVDKVGDVFAYSLDRRTNRWSPATRINDVPAIAKEGFQAVAGTHNGTFHSAWLDLRDDKKNKIVGATSTDGGRTWSTNKVIYRSPSGTVCECCKVSIVAKSEDVYVQFRNWLDGSRDIYLAHSKDGGRTYAQPEKLGRDTWKLNACPMDGGAVALERLGKPLTVWRRENKLFTCQPGEPEQEIATGRNVTLATASKNRAIAWDEAGTVWLKINDKSPASLGKGQMPSIALTSQAAICVWESDGQIMMQSTLLN
jgi:hypothetical protein